jgi:hypothetical protein
MKRAGFASQEGSKSVILFSVPYSPRAMYANAEFVYICLEEVCYLGQSSLCLGSDMGISATGSESRKPAMRTYR